MIHSLAPCCRARAHSRFPPLPLSLPSLLLRLLCRCHCPVSCLTSSDSSVAPPSGATAFSWCHRRNTSPLPLPLPWPVSLVHWCVMFFFFDFSQLIFLYFLVSLSPPASPSRDVPAPTLRQSIGITVVRASLLQPSKPLTPVTRAMVCAGPLHSVSHLPSPPLPAAIPNVAVAVPTQCAALLATTSDAALTSLLLP
jgi:hypothetical protein